MLACWNPVRRSLDLQNAAGLRIRRCLIGGEMIADWPERDSASVRCAQAMVARWSRRKERKHEPSANTTRPHHQIYADHTEGPTGRPEQSGRRARQL